MAYRNLDLLDKKILNLVADNARMPFLEVARICNVSGAAIHQRMAKMTKMGLIKGSKYVIDPEKLGYETCAYVGLYLKDPATFDDVVEKLRMIPEVTECHYTTGGYDMFIKLYARTNHDLLNIIHDRLQPLGLSRSETIVSFNAVIDRQLPVPEDIIEDDVEGVTLSHGKIHALVGIHACLVYSGFVEGVGARLAVDGGHDGAVVVEAEDFLHVTVLLHDP